MSTTVNNNDVFEKYFHAWQTHDVTVLSDLFHENAVYVRQGKPDIVGFKEIRKYWERNKERQLGLTIYPHVPILGTNNACSFCAQFVDADKKQKQIVHGWMTLELLDQKIFSLREGYYVHREAIATKSPRSFRSMAGNVAKRIRWAIVENWTRLTQLLAVQLTRIVYYLIVIILGGSAFGIGKFPDPMICTLALDFSNCQFAELPVRTLMEAKATKNLGYIILFAVVILPFLYRMRHSYLKPVDNIRLVGEGQDLAEMKKRFRTSKDVVIHAGDFDFVGQDAEFREIFTALDLKNALSLVSDKSEPIVRNGFGASPDATLLLSSLIQKKRILFDDPRKLRCSIIRRWDFPEVLYRYDHGGGEEDQHRLRICVLRGRGDVGPVVELLRRSIRSAA